MLNGIYFVLYGIQFKKIIFIFSRYDFVEKILIEVGFKLKKHRNYNDRKKFNTKNANSC